MKVNVNVKDNITYVIVEGSINSSNANEFGDKIKELPGLTNGIIIDASNLEYISSAGLRVILSAKKRCEDKVFKIINVSSEVMDVFQITGFSEIMDIEQAFKKISIDGCEIIGKGACGECYRIDDETIIKLYYGACDMSLIEHEKSLAKKAFVMGIPTAISYDIVEANGRIGVVYELIKSKTIVEMIKQDRSKMDEYIKMYADVCKKIHSIKTDDPEIPSFKEANREDIVKILNISDEERMYLNKFLDMVPNDKTCIHGDLNINNIMVQDGECCLIDMGEFSTGTPMFDISRILFSMVYANPKDGEYNSFYKLQAEDVLTIYNKFFKEYFGADNVNEAEATHPEIKWLYPLAWFRCCTSMLKNNKWPEEKRKMAYDLLRNKLIPFIKEEERNK